jgi:2-oxoisovalerate dehydrogenase E1 component alpha subunit
MRMVHPQQEERSVTTGTIPFEASSPARLDTPLQEQSIAISATLAPPSIGDGGVPRETLREMFRLLVLSRAIDERVWQLNRSGKAAFVVSGQGHEGAQIGAAFGLDRERDIILPYYRDLALSVAFGLTAHEIMLSTLARAGDPLSGSRQMPSHYSAANRRIISGSSVVSTQISIATGTAYAAKLRGTGQVSLTSFGEGGSSEGDFHEGCNFAGIHKLPVLFLCQNNKYAISVPQSLQVAIENVADRAAGYGFPGVIVDGTDVLAVYNVTKTAAERARRGEGPTLIEAKLYRYQPHSSDDDDRVYRSADEVSEWRAKDPVALFAARMLETGTITEGEQAEIRAEIKAEVDAATEAAEAAPMPDPATYADHVYGA